MAELDERRLEVSLLNHPTAEGVPGDLRETWQQVVTTYRRRAGANRPSLLSACPPCQGLSSARSDRGRAEDADAGSRDHRNLLVVVIANVAQALLPRFVVVENVPAFLTRKVRHPVTNDPISAASLLISLLSAFYWVFPILTDLCDYGVPQSRKRAFLTFVRKDVLGLRQFLAAHRAPYPRPTHATDYGGGPVTLRQALAAFQLPSLDAFSDETATDPQRPLHAVPVWRDRRYPMVAAIPPYGGGSAWDNNQCGRCGVVDVSADDALCPRCGEPLLRPVVENSNGTYRLVNGFRSSSYRRMHPDQPASTVTTASGHIGSDITIHPSENRLLSTLECQLLQTIPADFNWGMAIKLWGPTNVRAMIGEAVPPLFTRQHGATLVGLDTGKWSHPPISLSDERCANAREKLGLSYPTYAAR